MLKLKSTLAFLLSASLFVLINCDQQNGEAYEDSIRAQTPNRISQIKQKSQDTFEMTWTINKTNASSVEYTRYRILVSDGWPFEASSQEWPAQLEMVKYDMNVSPYMTLSTESNYECFNLCIQDPECLFVIRSSKYLDGNNCLFKNTSTTTTTTDIDADSEYALVGDYKSTIVVGNLSSNRVYSFKVAVYDAQAQAWSNFSESSYPFQSPVTLAMDFTRNGINSGSLNWTNQKWQISRYNMEQIYNFTDKFNISNLNKDALKADKFGSSYFSIENYTNFIKVQSESDCIDMCKSSSSCVQLVYFSDDFLDINGSVVAPKQSCYLNDMIDMSRGIYRQTNTTVLSLINDKNSYDILYAQMGSWQFYLDAVTPYGFSNNRSALARYNITTVQPTIREFTDNSTTFIIKWDIDEPLQVKRVAFFYSLNDSSQNFYTTENSTDFYEPNPEMLNVTSFNDCYMYCFNQTSCEAYKYSTDTSICTLYTSTQNKTSSCPDDSICGIFPPVSNTFIIAQPLFNTLYDIKLQLLLSSFEYVTPPSQGFRITDTKNLRMRTSYPFYPGRQSSIDCLVIQNNEKVNWYQNGQLLDETRLNALNAKLLYNKTTLSFYNITSRNNLNGLYLCDNTLNNGQLFVAPSPIEIRVNETAPGYPYDPAIVPIVHLKKPGVLLTWTIDPYVLPVTCIYFYWSTDHTNFNSTKQCTETLRGGSFAYYNQSFDCQTTTFKFEVENIIGKSQMTYEFGFDQNDCPNTPLPPKKPQTFKTAFIVSIGFASIFLVIIIGVFLKQYLSKRENWYRFN